MKMFYLLLLVLFMFIPFVNQSNAMSEAVRNFNETAFEGLGQGRTGGEIPADMDPAILEEAANYEFQGTGIVRSVPEGIGKVVGAGLSFLSIIFLLLVIYGGFLWMFAQGNEQEIEKAKNLIQTAVIGLVIVLSAYALTSYLAEAIN